MRVAVVGAGAAGSACAWRLLTGAGAKGLSVTLLEMGRGPGGRAGTRQVREVPGLHVNHGAPLFHVPSAHVEVRPLISALLASGHVAEWKGTHGSLNAKTGAVGSAGASRGEAELGSQAFARYAGVPKMSSVAGGCLQLAREAKADSLHTQFGVRVKEFRPQKSGDVLTGWQVLDKDGQDLGVFDYVVVSGATPALERWRAGFGEEPPVLAAAEASGSPLFRKLLSNLDKPLEYEQTHVVMLAWDLSNAKNAELVTQSFQKLPFSVTKVEEDESLAKVLVQNAGPEFAVVALHSTMAFARKYKKVMGSGSYVSVANNVEGSTDSEAAVAEELFASLQRLLDGGLPRPTWGPALHRWGAAFPKPDLGPEGAEKAWALPDAHFVLCGDFLAPPHACVSSALRSGVAAADAVLRLADGLPVTAPALGPTSAL